jgi:hypothetical protein
MKVIRGGRADEPIEMRPVVVEGLEGEQLGALVDVLLGRRQAGQVLQLRPDVPEPPNADR